MLPPVPVPTSIIVYVPPPGIGMTINQAPGTPSHWMAYVGVDDVRASTTKAKDLGAKVVQDVMEVGEYGTMSVIADPTGATIAMWQAKGQKKSSRSIDRDRRGFL